MFTRYIFSHHEDIISAHGPAGGGGAQRSRITRYVPRVPLKHRQYVRDGMAIADQERGWDGLRIIAEYFAGALIVSTSARIINAFGKNTASRPRSRTITHSSTSTFTIFYQVPVPGTSYSTKPITDKSGSFFKAFPRVMTRPTGRVRRCWKSHGTGRVGSGQEVLKHHKGSVGPGSGRVTL